MRHNPYDGQAGEWLRGSFHGHSRPNSSCASVPLDEGIQKYQAIGAQFMAVTDHDWVTDLEAMQTAHPEIVLLHGFEHSSQEHVAFVGDALSPAWVRLHQLPLREALSQAAGLLTILNHPQAWEAYPAWTLDKVRALSRLPDGMEIVNGHYGTPRIRAKGMTGQYTRLWDELLTAGLRIWGFANDDFHDPVDLGNAFNMVLAQTRTPAAILAAARRGCFYASTGLMLTQVETQDETIHVSVCAACAGRFIGPGGETLAEGEGQRFTYVARGESYVRFEAQSPAGQLFLQPFFRS
jgi:hypothetical protein